MLSKDPSLIPTEILKEYTANPEAIYYQYLKSQPCSFTLNLPFNDSIFPLFSSVSKDSLITSLKSFLLTHPLTYPVYNPLPLL